MLLHFYEFIISMIFVYVMDRLSIFISNKHMPSNTERWFFIHTLVNLIITYLSSFELYLCINDIQNCSKHRLMNNSGYILMLAKASHIYHLLFFKNLSYYEYLHHMVMCVFCGPLAYLYNKTRMFASTMFFLSGLPGLIDYSNLYLVKRNYMNSHTQKYIYFIINLWLRSPGLIFMGTSQLLYNNTNNFDEYIVRIILALCVIWNSQYFLLLTIKDVINKNIINNKV